MIAALFGGCASVERVPAQPEGPAAGETKLKLKAPNVPEAVEERLSPEIEVSEEQEERIAKAQDDVYDLVQGTATRIDSFFGTVEGDTQASVTRGRLSVGGQYDAYNELDGRVRFNAKITLPAFEQRTRIIVSRGDADDAASGVDDSDTPSLPSRFDDISDDEWLFGIGYSRDKKLRRGWSFDAGIKLTTPVEPYVRATYKWNQGIGDAWLFRMRPRVYWQKGRGDGWSVSTTLDWSPYDDWLYRLYTIALDDDRTEGTRWTAKAFTYHSLSPKSAFSYGLYARGETEAEVTLQDYGFEVRHRRQISRNYLFVEFLAYMSWPRELLIEEREATPGVGIEFELQFGRWPGRESPLRKRADDAGINDIDGTMPGTVDGSAMPARDERAQRVCVMQEPGTDTDRAIEHCSHVP